MTSNRPLYLSHTLEAEGATRQLPWLVLSYEQQLQDPAAAVQRLQHLAGLPITTPSAELLDEWIRPGLNRHQGSAEGAEPNGEAQTLLHWANTVYAALVEPAAKQQRQTQDRAYAVVHQKLRALLEQGSLRVQLQLFWEPEEGRFFGSGLTTPLGDGGARSRQGGVSASCRRRAPMPAAVGSGGGARDGIGAGHADP